MAGSNVKLLENYISYCSLKNKVISKNIANIGTEDYNRQDVVFKTLLTENINAPMKVTEGKHIGSPEMGKDVDIIVDNTKTEFTGVNNVDIDQEMAELAENQIRFKFATRKLSSYYKNLQAVIKGGGNT
ncbi:MAG: flagellar basal body rod protein FlgB [Ignavibacteriaceae bacterium]|nr:flagellar basal body rod protein FlgB [Ignavibacteriaceae bacterium]HRI45514.1 flagellar basal body rod protein FlgB [Ignavibacteriaceae bacterium]